MTGSIETMHSPVALVDSHRTALGMSSLSSPSESTLSSCDLDSVAISKITRQPLIEFKLFPELPTELRLKIWNQALFLPRIIEVRAHDPEEGIIHMTEPNVVPYSLLRVNREARREAQKNLPLRNTGLLRFATTRYRVNWDLDIFYFDFSSCVRIIRDASLAREYGGQIRHLLLPSRIFEEHPRPYAEALLSVIFKNVENLAVVVVEGPRTSWAAELITLNEAAERNSVAKMLIGSSTTEEMKLKMQEFETRVRKRLDGCRVPFLDFRLMAMDRVGGMNMSNSEISFRI